MGDLRTQLASERSHAAQLDAALTQAQAAALQRERECDALRAESSAAAAAVRKLQRELDATAHRQQLSRPTPEVADAAVDTAGLLLPPDPAATEQLARLGAENGHLRDALERQAAAAATESDAAALRHDSELRAVVAERDALRLRLDLRLSTSSAPPPDAGMAAQTTLPAPSPSAAASYASRGVSQSLTSTPVQATAAALPSPHVSAPRAVGAGLSASDFAASQQQQQQQSHELHHSASRHSSAPSPLDLFAQTQTPMPRRELSVMPHVASAAQPPHMQQLPAPSPPQTPAAAIATEEPAPQSLDAALSRGRAGPHLEEDAAAPTMAPEQSYARASAAGLQSSSSSAYSSSSAAAVAAMSPEVGAFGPSEDGGAGEMLPQRVLRRMLVRPTGDIEFVYGRPTPQHPSAGAAAAAAASADETVLSTTSLGDADVPPVSLPTAAVLTQSGAAVMHALMQQRVDAPQSLAAVFPPTEERQHAPAPAPAVPQWRVEEEPAELRETQSGAGAARRTPPVQPQWWAAPRSIPAAPPAAAAVDCDTRAGSQPGRFGLAAQLPPPSPPRAVPRRSASAAPTRPRSSPSSPFSSRVETAAPAAAPPLAAAAAISAQAHGTAQPPRRLDTALILKAVAASNRSRSAGRSWGEVSAAVSHALAPPLPEAVASVSLCLCCGEETKLVMPGASETRACKSSRTCRSCRLIKWSNAAC